MRLGKSLRPKGCRMKRVGRLMKYPRSTVYRPGLCYMLDWEGSIAKGGPMASSPQECSVPLTRREAELGRSVSPQRTENKG